jgi:hypothetical protein
MSNIWQLAVQDQQVASQASQAAAFVSPPPAAHLVRIVANIHSRTNRRTRRFPRLSQRRFPDWRPSTNGWSRRIPGLPQRRAWHPACAYADSLSVRWHC